MMAAAEGKEIDSQGAMSFVVSFDDFPTRQGKLPKGLATRNQQRQAKSTLTEEILAEKQKKAEERRKKLAEEKLEKLHQLEEDMAGLARKIQAQAEARDTASTPASSSEKDVDSWSQEAKLAGNHVPNGVKPNGLKC